MMKNMFLTLSVLFLLSACTWVKPTPQGSQVKFVEQNSDVLASCKKMGSLTTMVKHEIGFYKRSADKVNVELITFAQNEAVEMGGDTIAAEGPAENGRRTFSVYRCRE